MASTHSRAMSCTARGGTTTSRPADRRIAVIGNGSTGVQIVSALQREADHITHFVRTPQWVIWAPMGLPQPGLVGAILRRSPALHRRFYGLLLRGSRILTDIALRPTWQRRLAQYYARLCLRLQVRDRELRDRLTPDYEPFCKRQVISGSYYRAIRSRNAEVSPPRSRRSRRVASAPRTAANTTSTC